MPVLGDINDVAALDCCAVRLRQNRPEQVGGDERAHDETNHHQPSTKLARLDQQDCNRHVQGPEHLRKNQEQKRQAVCDRSFRRERQGEPQQPSTVCCPANTIGIAASGKSRGRAARVSETSPIVPVTAAVTKLASAEKHIGAVQPPVFVAAFSFRSVAAAGEHPLAMDFSARRRRASARWM